MIHAINLLPNSCRNRQRRAVRRNAWIGVASAACLLVACSWIGLRAINRAADRQERQLDDVLIKQTELDRQLMTATVQRNELARRAETLATLRQNRDAGYLPVQLFNLTQSAPEGVVLTEIHSLPPQLSSRSPSRGPEAATGADLSANSLNSLTPNASTLITGFASDHGELTLLIDALKRIANWNQVELIRAAREPYLNKTALSFRLECRRMENAK